MVGWVWGMLIATWWSFSWDPYCTLFRNVSTVYGHSKLCIGGKVCSLYNVLLLCVTTKLADQKWKKRTALNWPGVCDGSSCRPRYCSICHQNAWWQCLEGVRTGHPYTPPLHLTKAPSRPIKHTVNLQQTDTKQWNIVTEQLANTQHLNWLAHDSQPKINQMLKHYNFETVRSMTHVIKKTLN